ncbi:hypothetical protein PR048_010927 [Dryococelus australis]|uniref:Uncharacterized protein n=1 Tax=Dryococelus australis TaxID=614101 RepID=A0ABQ9HK52_9NEOP|nr:hypothetical protein PR048_010927 [Dryococelus australis]
MLSHRAVYNTTSYDPVTSVPALFCTTRCPPTILEDTHHGVQIETQGGTSIAVQVWNLVTTTSALMEELRENIIIGQPCLHQQDINIEMSKERLHASTAS